MKYKYPHKSLVHIASQINAGIIKIIIFINYFFNFILTLTSRLQNACCKYSSLWQTSQLCSVDMTESEKAGNCSNVTAGYWHDPRVRLETAWKINAKPDTLNISSLAACYSLCTPDVSTVIVRSTETFNHPVQYYALRNTLVYSH
jgi:hypothetical protein